MYFSINAEKQNLSLSLCLSVSLSLPLSIHDSNYLDCLIPDFFLFTCNTLHQKLPQCETTLTVSFFQQFEESCLRRGSNFGFDSKALEDMKTSSKCIVPLPQASKVYPSYEHLACNYYLHNELIPSHPQCLPQDLLLSPLGNVPECN
jgi:hypothetical protein